ncbi:TonB-dependent receptor [Sphingomonas donggukensis]|uniref:TonB-dependent receptor n=1 Tax=Sphingomonas donggukensis TaxID=2949093 RepID=A0ABY4TQC2_9SPHN|nr:TonB-dependent receptor [Sphingomonas donggukensis]URW74595.1 TonB-dependent receptor [Sphingomonas donggukensis]
MTRIPFLLATTAAFLTPGGAYAQSAPAPTPAPEAETEAGDGAESEPITVVGQRERGSVPGDIKPEQVIRAADIRAYGVSSITELLAELSPQIGAGRGRDGGQPVVLLNGRRISGFREIRDLPTEAIERTEILPPEAAQQLGYRADQRVVNIVLRRRFRAVTAELQGSGATAGDRYTAASDVNIVRIARDKRLNVNVHYDGATPIYEDDRDIVPTPPTRPYGILGNLTPANGQAVIDPSLGGATVAGVPEGATGRLPASAFLNPANSSDFGAYRTLAAATRKFSANGTYSRPIGKVAASLNVNLESTSSDSELGLASTSFTVPAGNPFSPFTNPVTVNRYLLEAGPRERSADGTLAHVGLALNGDVGTWRWSLTSNYDRTLSRTLTDAGIDFTPLAARIAANDPAINPFARFDAALVGPYAQDFARSVSNVANVEGVANGPLLTLPAGKVNASVKAGFENSDFDARAIRAGVATTSGTTRGVGSGQVRVDVPITSRRNDVLAAIGNLSLNGSYAVDRTSDFGALTTYGYGLNWSPIPQVFFLASVNDEDGAPTTAQLTNPVIVTPAARIFDFVTGQSVDVQRIDGGNPNLRADSRRVTALTLNVTPLNSVDLRLSAEYTATRTLSPIASLPAPTAALEAAFPDRFTRDAAGQLVRFDNRPVNFARSDQQQLRTGITFSRRLGKMPERPASGFGGFGGRRGGQGDGAAPAVQPGSTAPPPASGDAPRAEGGEGRRSEGQRGEGRGGFGGGGFGGGNFNPNSPRAQAFFASPQARALGNVGRLQVSVFHTWRLEDSVLIRPGVPQLDLLDGDALDTRGGRAKHQLEFNAGITRGGYGLRASGNWQSGTFVRGGTPRAPTDLNFAPLTTLTLRAFADFNPLMKVTRDHPVLRGLRVQLAVRNVFDAKLKVTDATGTVPLNYQPDLLDPTGRVVSISLRKLLF